MIVARLPSIARDAHRLGEQDACKGAAYGQSIESLMCPLRDRPFGSDNIRRAAALVVNLTCVGYIEGWNCGQDKLSGNVV